MKFICNKQELYEAINNVSKAVAIKSPITALEGVKFELKNSTLYLTGYNLEIGIKTKINVKSEDEGKLVINARLFLEIIKRMPTDEINIDISENMIVSITSGSTEYTISANTIDEYPELPEFDHNESITLSQTLLKNMINQTIFAVATNETKPILTGELFEIENNNLNIVAIDGYRLALRTSEVNSNKNFKFVIPAKALNEVAKLLKDDEELTCKIQLSQKHIIFDISGYELFSRLLEGEFHNYKNSIPTSNTTEVIINTKDLIHSLERASLLINERIKTHIKCTFKDGSLQTSCSSTLGKVNDIIKADITGDPITIGFNNKFFIDPLKTIEDDKIKLLMNGSRAPLTIKPLEGDDFTFLVLPVRLNDE